MATTFREDTDAATLVELLEHGIVHLALVYFRCNLELDAWESLCRTDLAIAVQNLAILTDIFAAGQLADSYPTFERLLDAELLRSMYFQNFRARSRIVHRRKHDEPSDLEVVALKVCSYSADEGGVVDGVGEVYQALAGPRAIHSSTNGQSTHVACEPPDKLSPHRFLGDQEADAAGGFHAYDAHEDQRVHELACQVRSAGLPCVPYFRIAWLHIPGLHGEQQRR